MFETSPQSLRACSFEPSHQRLVSKLQACAQRAAETGRPAILRWHVALPADAAPCDPWRFWLTARAPLQPFFIFNDGRSGLCAAAWGRLQERMLPRRGRFAAAQGVCSELLEQVVDVAAERGTPIDVDAPLVFAGFSFDEADSRAGIGNSCWDSWQGGSVYLPSTLVYRRDSHSWVVLATEVTHDADVQALAAALQKRLAVFSEVSQNDPASASSDDAALPMELLEDEAAWSQRVNAARAATSEHDLDKVVLARAADLQAPPGAHFSPEATLWALREAHPASICFAMGRADGSCFLGATPEILVHVSGRVLRTQAVAGTAPRGASVAEDAELGAALVNSAKDRREHAVVADVLTDTLRPLCVELHRPSEPRLIRLPRLQHLETPFNGMLRQAGGILDLVARLHPTPSVGGWPAAAAQQWLAHNEPMDRGWYAAPLGWLTAAGDGVFAVAIRSVLMQGDRARAYAGAGIVPASDARAEWQETELKLRTVREALRWMYHG